MKTQTTTLTLFRTTAASVALVLLMFAVGCKSDDQKAIDQAKAQAASTNTAQQVQYVDKNGNTVTTVVQPPATAGQAPQISTTTTPPPPGPVPHSTFPSVTPMGTPAGQPLAQPADGSVASTTQPPAPANGQSAPMAPVQMTVPSGTELAIRINQNINVKHVHAGDHFSGEVVEPVMVNGAMVIPRGTPVSGRIDEAHRRGHFKGSSVLELRLTSMTLNGSQYPIDTNDNVHTKKGKGKRTAGFIGGMTGAGMLIGGIATGGVGLAIGAAAGAGTGTVLAGTTGNRDIDIPAESVVHFRLVDPLVI